MDAAQLPTSRYVFPIFVRPTGLYCCLVFAFAFGGCRIERVEPDPTPTPTPTPTPSPTPTPIPTPTPTPTPIISGAESLEEEIAETNAEAVFAASTHVAEALQTFEDLMGTPENQPGTENLETAALALESAGNAYHRMEAAVYYIDPENPEELEALPDPNGSSWVPSQVTSLEILDGTLTALSTASTAASRRDIVGSALDEAREFRSRMEIFAAGWEPSDPGNFRNRIFVSDPPDAVARMFQGVLSVTDTVIAEETGSGEDDSPVATGSDSPFSATLADTLDGVRRTLEGDYPPPDDVYPPIQGPGLAELIRTRWPHGADAIEQSMLDVRNMVDEAGGQTVSPEFRNELLTTLNEFTELMTLAGRTLGMEFESHDSSESP